MSNFVQKLKDKIKDQETSMDNAIEQMEFFINTFHARLNNAVEGEVSLLYEVKLDAEKALQNIRKFNEAIK